MTNAHLTSRDIVMFSDINNLWGDTAYEGFQHHLQPRKPLLNLGLKIFASGIRTGPTRVLSIAVAILLHPHLTVFDRTADAVLYGPSKNNRLILKRISALLADDPVRQCFAARKARLGARLNALLRFDTLRALAAALAPYKDSRTLPAAQLLLTAAARLYFETRLAGSEVQIVVVANDHSPMQVGLRDSAYACNIRCVYCQHAPTSPLYPPLRFDLSILSSQQSLDTYRRCGPLSGDVVFLSPFENKPIPHAPIAQIGTVGVCLSRVPRRVKVIDRLQELRSLPDVTQIKLRGHPQGSFGLRDLAAIDPRISVTDPDNDLASFARACDVIVVPGSGVLIELLHNGTVCVYAGDLDQLGHDPHGFVASGLVPDFTYQKLDSLTANLSGFFNPDWHEKYSRFDSTMTYETSTLEEEARAALMSLLQPRKRSK